jgi:hypothetical protein
MAAAAASIFGTGLGVAVVHDDDDDDGGGGSVEDADCEDSDVAATVEIDDIEFSRFDNDDDNNSLLFCACCEKEFGVLATIIAISTAIITPITGFFDIKSSVFVNFKLIMEHSSTV